MYITHGYHQELCNEAVCKEVAVALQQTMMDWLVGVNSLSTLDPQYHYLLMYIT